MWQKGKFQHFTATREFWVEPKGQPKQTLLPEDLIGYDGWWVQLYRVGVEFEHLTLRACVPAGWIVPSAKTLEWTPRDRMTADQIKAADHPERIGNREANELRTLYDKGASIEALAERFRISPAHALWIATTKIIG